MISFTSRNSTCYTTSLNLLDSTKYTSTSIIIISTSEYHCLTNSLLYNYHTGRDTGIGCFIYRDSWKHNILQLKSNVFRVYCATDVDDVELCAICLVLIGMHSRYWKFLVCLSLPWSLQFSFSKEICYLIILVATFVKQSWYETIFIISECQITFDDGSLNVIAEARFNRRVLFLTSRSGACRSWRQSNTELKYSSLSLLFVDSNTGLQASS